jgi:3'-phosphoadenosine 5'-phosphosulfate sulfotransferase (PAPS reductase)/FAD synthetase
MKHIIQFSGGCASTYTAYLVSKEQKKEDIILLFHDTKVECKDSYRFRRQVSEYLDIPITEVSDGRDLWEVIKDNNCLPSDRFPFCTRILKLEPAEKYLKTIQEPYILYNGFGKEEWRRIQKSLARAEGLNRVVKSPLYDLGISNDEVKRIIRDEWKICLPSAYKYLSHSNCIPCFKAGKGHFKAIAKYYPEEFEKACKAEEEIGYTVFEDITLRQLREQVLSQLDLFSIEESIPCMCSV